MGNFIPSWFSFSREKPLKGRILLNCWLGCISNYHQGTIFS